MRHGFLRMHLYFRVRCKPDAREGFSFPMFGPFDWLSCRLRFSVLRSHTSRFAGLQTFAFESASRHSGGMRKAEGRGPENPRETNTKVF